MEIIKTIEYLSICIVGFYLTGLAAVWGCEMKRSSLYRQMKEQIKVLESFQLSAALFHAKSYKIKEDYRRNDSNLERVQQFIIENMLLIRKSTLKTE